jgi:SAM-dependent methyltransferase
MDSAMGSFWDERADEDAFFFVDSRQGYRHPDLESFWAEGKRDLDLLLSALGAEIQPNDRVVEIGCGVGRLTRVISERAASVRALDVSARMLELAKEHNAQLKNVEWLHGGGATLDGIESESADACVSHVVFQHIPDPEVTLSYVREIGRVLLPGGWAAFQISNDPQLHESKSVSYRVRQAWRAALGRGPRGQQDPRWRGSMIRLDALRAAADDGSMDIERVVGEGTQYCIVLTRRRANG